MGALELLAYELRWMPSSYFQFLVTGSQNGIISQTIKNGLHY